MFCASKIKNSQIYFDRYMYLKLGKLIFYELIMCKYQFKVYSQYYFVEIHIVFCKHWCVGKIIVSIPVSRLFSQVLNQRFSCLPIVNHLP